MTNKERLRPTAGRGRKWLVGGVAAAVATVTTLVGFAGPAAADPFTTYVAVGSDTTQDAMDALAAGAGLGSLGSYDAVDPTGQTITPTTATPPGTGPLIKTRTGCTFTRPNGSGAGLAELQYSINTGTTNQPGGTKPGIGGCVDIGRSSSGPTFNAAGMLVYIPFALDGVTSATGPKTAVTTGDPALATELVDANLFTKANLTTLYSCTAITVNGKSYDPNATADNPTATPPIVMVKLKVPQSGSGTRKFWAAQLGFSDGSVNPLPTCVKDTYVDSTVTPPVTKSVEEHDGSAYAHEANAFGPFSIAQYIAQTNGFNPRLHNVAIHSLGTDSPTTENPTTPWDAVNGVPGANPKLNTTFVITREVYNIVELARITSGNAKFDPVLTGLLVGSSSVLCSQSFTIQQYGFATLATSPLGHTCGATGPNLTAVPTI